jgi:bifunctional DNA-binding transcriptional regulator/antitoxin component of YhaV-PrlF toxin-antitoxin module
MPQAKGPIEGLSKVWLTNKISATLIIPIDIARKYDLNEPSHVVVEERPEEKGILIKKLET